MTATLVVTVAAMSSGDDGDSGGGDSDGGEEWRWWEQCRCLVGLVVAAAVIGGVGGFVSGVAWWRWL